MKEQRIEKEVFEKFFTESYCPVDYETVREEFIRIAQAGNDIFTGSYEVRNLNRDNFILYLTSESYCDFEAAVQEADGDEITEKYWETQRELLHTFLLHLYDEVLCRWK